MSSQAPDSVISSDKLSQVQTYPTAVVAVPIELTESLTWAVGSLVVLTNQATPRWPPVPVPKRFHVGDNYCQWEGQARGHLKRPEVPFDELRVTLDPPPSPRTRC
ncbi:hypothetical protein FGIG_09046 [Fasciola gigantica]|uniref:Uncharacterized protein n=1 Tax=Fasciola gigantica TaxID=46835 RepID=A0A504YWM8_FASGI|nr:hypothetical protein FGIG_09046 [Fasciola gigantica]